MIRIMRRSTEEVSNEERLLIETARWHTLRYDGLRASLTNRASFMVSANAVLIAGTSFLFSWFYQRSIYGGKSSAIIVSLGLLVSLIFSLLSIRRASQALISNTSWRKLYGADPPLSLFYQHSDTIKAVPGYTEFAEAFKSQTLSHEAECAIVNLWLILRTHAYRYRFLRSATNEFQIAVLAFAGTAVVAVALGLAK
jgi:hypothetical protein